MDVAAEEQEGGVARRPSRALLVVTAVVVLCLVATGFLLWARQGSAVFGDTVLAALAWCF